MVFVTFAHHLNHWGRWRGPPQPCLKLSFLLWELTDQGCHLCAIPDTSPVLRGDCLSHVLPIPRVGYDWCIMFICCFFVLLAVLQRLCVGEIGQCIDFKGMNGPRQANLVLIAYASSEGSGEPAHPRSLARTYAARSYKQWVKRNLQAESQIPGPSEWLDMRS